MATETVKVVKIDTAPAQTSVQDLRKELKELKNTLLSTEQGTEEYNQALERAAEISHTLKEQTEELNASAMDFGQITGNIVKATGGMVAGFQAVKATMSIMGIENENIIASLKKMQDLMAITQALPSIDNGIKAFKRLGLVIKTATATMDSFRVALAATGIGAAVAALGLLIANWDKVSDAMQRWGIINEDTEKKIQEQIQKINDLRGELSKLQGDYDNYVKDKKVSKLNSEAKQTYQDLADQIEDYKKRIEIIVATQKVVYEEQKRGWRERWEELNQEGIALLNNISALEKQQQAILDNEDSYKKLDKSAKKAVNTTKELAMLLESSKSIFNRTLQQELDMKFEGKPIKVPAVVEFEVEDVDVSKADEFRKKIEQTVESLRTSFMTPEEQYAKEINALDVALQTKLIKEEEYLKLRDALNKEQTQREIQRYATAASGIGQIFTSLGDMMEEGTKEQKALQIMGATINMLGGITAAIAGAFTTHSGPWDIALAAIQAAAIAASGAATISQMAKTNKNNALSTSKSSPNTSAINNIIAPVQYTKDVQGAQIEGAIKDSRVYVVESDITNTQNKVRVSENEAVF